MTELFLSLVNLSIKASWLVLAVILIRCLFKRIPKNILCILWGLVGIRLVMPFSIQTTLSLLPSSQTINTSIHQSKPVIETGIHAIDVPINHSISTYYFEGVTVKAGYFESLVSILSIIWIIGMILMIVYSVYSYYKIYKKVYISLQYSENVYICDDIDTPFVLGVINPKIYIPSYLSDEQIYYVLKHEYSHIKRKDHLYKPFAFLLLTVYWFNPILWFAYILLCRDIEAACDEYVIKHMENQDKKSYLDTLFKCSVQRYMIMACPLAFGETDVKSRVKNIIKYKKPTVIISVVSILLCILAAISFLTDPLYNRIIDINDSSLNITLLDNVSEIHCNLSIIDDNDEVNKMIKQLYDIKVSRKEISKSRDENRDKTYSIGLKYDNDYMTYVNISHDYSSLWIDNGVKPTYSYKINNVSHIKEICNELFKDNSYTNHSYSDIVGLLKKYDNGYTYEDLTNIGELCMHPRGTYMNNNNYIYISSEPHVLMSYMIDIEDRNRNITTTIFIDEKDYDEVTQILQKYNYIRIDIEPETDNQNQIIKDDIDQLLNIFDYLDVKFVTVLKETSSRLVYNFKYDDMEKINDFCLQLEKQGYVLESSDGTIVSGFTLSNHYYDMEIIFILDNYIDEWKHIAEDSKDFIHDINENVIIEITTK